MFFQEEIIFLVVTGLLFLVTPHDKARAYNSSYSLMLPLMILVIIGALKGIHTINKDFYRDVILFSKTIVYIIAGIALSKFVKDLNDFFKYFLFIALVSALVHIWLLVINIHSISSLETIRFYAGFGNDTYKFSVGDGSDVISENGGTMDTVLFDSSATLASIGLYQDSYGNLQLGYGAYGDMVTIQGQGTTDGNVERFQTSDGHYLTDSDVALVLQDMSSYATSHSISMTSLSDVENNANLMAIINGAWHAA